MDETPIRRWFQIRLSTWFVLMAILAWAMAQLPLFTPEEQHERALAWGSYSPLTRDILRLEAAIRAFERLGGPALALVVFLSWKLAWRRCSAAQSLIGRIRGAMTIQ